MPDSLSLSGISCLYQSAFNQYSSLLKKEIFLYFLDNPAKYLLYSHRFRPHLPFLADFYHFKRSSRNAWHNQLVHP